MVQKAIPYSLDVPARPKAPPQPSFTTLHDSARRSDLVYYLSPSSRRPLFVNSANPLTPAAALCISRLAYSIFSFLIFKKWIAGE